MTALDGAKPSTRERHQTLMGRVMKLLWLILVPCILLAPAAASAESVDLPQEGSATQAAAPSSPAGWWRRHDLIDYGIVAASLGGFYAVHRLAPPVGSGIGPSFDPAHPAAMLDPALASQIGRKHLIEDTGETVPAAYVGAAVPAIGLWLGLQTGMRQGGDARQVHDVLVGLSEGMATTLLLTEILKYQFGRLRPDFADRVQRYYCTTQKSAEVTCSGGEVPLDPDPTKADKIFADGRRSFPSGHSATSFFLATYAGLVTGGQLVWGDGAAPSSRPVGLALQGTALGLAGLVIWSRVHDGRHNPSDVLAGSLIGVAMANLAYWRRFDSHGRMRAKTGPIVTLEPGPAPMGVSLAVRF